MVNAGLDDILGHFPRLCWRAKADAWLLFAHASVKPKHARAYRLNGSQGVRRDLFLGKHLHVDAVFFHIGTVFTLKL